MSVARNWRSPLTSADASAGTARGRRSVACLLTCVLLGPVGGRAFAGAQVDPPTASDLKQLSIEDLMNLEVTSVAKEPQRLLQAAAAIQVITADDIRRSGASSIPEALRLADNLQVAQINAHDWAISARGFNANLANKLLVLVDGRAVYTPLYGGVLWNVQDCLLADIDRIEVISGPGGTLWGANSVKAASALTPVILLTGWGKRLLAENDIPAHVDRVLSKPPRLGELRAALAKLAAPRDPPAAFVESA